MSKIWLLGQICPTSCFCYIKFCGNTVVGFFSLYPFFSSCIVCGYFSAIVAQLSSSSWNRECMATDLKFLLWPFIENVCQSLPKSKSCWFSGDILCKALFLKWGRGDKYQSPRELFQTPDIVQTPRFCLQLKNHSEEVSCIFQLYWGRKIFWELAG